MTVISYPLHSYKHEPLHAQRMKTYPVPFCTHSPSVVFNATILESRHLTVLHTPNKTGTGFPEDLSSAVSISGTTTSVTIDF